MVAEAVALYMYSCDYLPLPERREQRTPRLLPRLVIVATLSVTTLLTFSVAYQSGHWPVRAYQPQTDGGFSIDLRAAYPPRDAHVLPYSPLAPNPKFLRWTNFSQPKNFTPSGPWYVEAVGELTVPLVHGDDESPRLTLQVVIRRFAAAGSTDVSMEGRASHGVILGHCGGPGSGASCGTWLASNYVVEHTPNGTARALGFDVVGITQRGASPNTPGATCSAITGSEPTLPPRSEMSEVVAEAPTIAEISHSCPCAYVEGAPAGYMWKDIDTGNESDVLRVWTTAQETADRCYNASYWQLTGPTGKTYHFLENMGTQALAYDLELLRRALGETQWSFYGASYGTAVAAVYASAFPERVSRIVLDGNAVPMPNLEWWGNIWGNTVAVVIDRMLENCRQQPACVLKDPFAAYRSVLAALHSKQLLSPPCANGARLALNSGLVVGYMHEMARGRGNGWMEGVRTVALLADADERRQEIGIVRVLDRMCRVRSSITWRLYGRCIDDVMVGVDTDPIMGTGVFGLDVAGRLSIPRGVQLWRSTKLLHGSDVTGHMLGYISSVATWRALPTPVAPFGSASVAPLVLGNLFDQATSYYRSQTMAAAFPRSSMLTYQGVGHCLDLPTDPANTDRIGTGECTELVIEYLRTGVLPVNGYTCRQQRPVPVPTSLNVELPESLRPHRLWGAALGH